MNIKINEVFRPDSDTKRLYYIYLSIIAIIFAAWIFPVSIVILLYVPSPASWIAASGLIIPYIVAIGFAAYWIPKYLSIVSYMLGEDRIVFERGIWWRRKSVVPYNRITNIDIVQGPISRYFGLGKISIQTAGYSGQSSSGGRLAEITIFGVKNFEEIKDEIMDLISKSKPISTEVGVESLYKEGLGVEILEELRKIRKGVKDLSNR